MGILKNISKILYSAFNVVILKRNRPIGLRFNITSKCCNDCSYCDVKNFKNDKELATGQVKEIIAKVAPFISYIVFSGGEPMLRDDIGQLISYCRDRGVKWIELNSSGVNVAERIDELTPVTALKLSLDGSKKVHDKLCGEGSFDSVMSAVRAAREKNIKVILNTVLTKNNLDQIDFLVSKAREESCTIVFEPLRVGAGYSNVEEIRPAVNDYRETIKKIMDYKKTDSLVVGNSLQGLKFIYDWPEYKQLDCPAGKLFAVIDSQGYLSACDHVIGSKVNKISLLEKDFVQAVGELLSVECKGCGCEGSLKLSRAINFEAGSLNELYHKLKLLNS